MILTSLMVEAASSIPLGRSAIGRNTAKLVLLGLLALVYGLFYLSFTMAPHNGFDEILCIGSWGDARVR